MTVYIAQLKGHITPEFCVAVVAQLFRYEQQRADVQAALASPAEPAAGVDAPAAGTAGDDPVDVAMERVARRNLAEVPSFKGLTLDQSRQRIAANDLINAELVARSGQRADLQLQIVGAVAGARDNTTAVDAGL